MDPLMEIAKKHNLVLVEDAAQSHIAEYKGKKIGSFGKATSFSFYPGKNLGAYGEGGALLTDDDMVAKNAKMLRDHGSLEKYNHEVFGHNYRMEGLQGAVLGVKLKYLNQWTELRRNNAEKYRIILEDFKKIKLPKEMPYAKHVYHLFVIQVLPNGKKSGNALRNELAEYLKQNGIFTGLHYPIPLHLQTCFKDLGYKKGDFPVSETLADTGLSLPMYPELSDDKIEFVASKIKEFFAQ